MESSKSIAFMLCFLAFALLSLSCHGSKVIKEFGEKDRIRRNADRTSSAVCCFFKKHLIRNNGNKELCFSSRPKRHRQDFMDEFPLATQASIIEKHRNSPLVRSIPNLPSPFSEVLVKDVVNQRGKAIAIPLVLNATITYADMPRTTRHSTVPRNIKTQMADMDRIPENPATDAPYDENGHLLAWSLGGGMNNVWNYVPQIERLNRDTIAGGLSSWREEESNIAKFLTVNKQGSVEWTMLVVYNDDNIMNFRPMGFCLVYSTTDNHNIKLHRNEMCFSNDPGSDCFFDERSRCDGTPTYTHFTIPG